MIGSCDCCDRTDVPVTKLVAFGIDTTACFVCQGGDDPDPCGELEESSTIARSHGRRMTLLEKHQAIVDAWFARWFAQEKARIDATFARRTKLVPSQNGETP